MHQGTAVALLEMLTSSFLFKPYQQIDGRTLSATKSKIFEDSNSVMVTSKRKRKPKRKQSDHGTLTDLQSTSSDSESEKSPKKV